MTSKIIIAPTKNLQKLILKSVHEGKTRWNYAVGFKDVRGWGISLGDADWCTEQNIIHVKK